MPSRRMFFLAASAAALLAPSTALALDPPVVFPERDFVAVDGGWPANTPFRLEVVRNGVVLTTSENWVTDANGVGEINHPGGACWKNFTPDILPGDVVRALELDGAGNPTGNSASTRTANVTAEQAQNLGGQVVIHGRAVSATGGPIALGNMEQRIVEPALLPFVGKRDVRAPGNGTLTYDPVGPSNPDGTRWTARYTSLGAAAQTAADGQTRIMSWDATNAAGDRLGLTIFEAGEVGGPGFGGCPLGARNAVTSPGTLNGAELAAGAPDVVIKGAAQPDATLATLAITDGTSTVDVPAVPVVGGAWSAAVPAAQLAPLADGPLTVKGTYTVPGGTITGSELTIVKDTVAPDAPASTPGAGTFDSAQSISLVSADPSATVRYTNDGSEPTKTSRAATGHVAVTSSQTIKAIAVDPAGNVSPVTTLGYVISPVKPQTIQLPGAAPVVVVQKAASPPALQLGRVTLRRSIKRAALRKSGLRAHVTLADDTEVLRVRVYRLLGGKRTLVTGFWRLPESGGLYKLNIRSKAIRAMRRGNYQLEITPGRSKRTLGKATRTTFEVR